MFTTNINASCLRENSQVIAAYDSTRAKSSFVKRLLDYFNDANKTKEYKKFDFSIIGGPHYSTDTKFGIGLVAAGLYRADRRDTLLPPSNVSIFSDISTVGFYMLGVRGTHIFPKDKYRLDYTTYFYSFPCKYWGIGYENGNDDANRTKMKRWQAQIQATFMIRVADNMYLGPSVSFDYIRGKDIKRPEIFEGQDRTTTNVGAGMAFVYDTRDVLTNAGRGVYLNISQLFRPRFLGNDHVFNTTNIQLDVYRRVWRGAILAADVRSKLNFGNPSWGMMALLGNSYSMRGYYEGRYRDKHKIEAQVELRQHVWRRNGIVLWAGAGTVFDKFSSIEAHKILPNVGIGYRWEFKKDVNVRLDYGIGKGGQSGFIFNINEAF
ncbi:MAG: BamA/TamA family outer membrane protein [Prevotella sp.]